MKEKDKKIAQAIKDLKHALEFEGKMKKDPFFFLGIAKSFEICFEYAWKYFRQRALDEGLEAISPREAIKMAGRLKIIDDVEKWLGFLEDRNLAVHDYLGLPNEQYLKTIKDFYGEVKKISI